MSVSRFLSSLAVTFLTIIGPALPAVAQSVVSLDSRLSNPSLPAGASMGWRSDAMASDGDRVLLGAWSAARAFLFERTSTGTWVLASEFAPPQSAPYFGIGVAIWGNEVVVGASQVSVGGLTQVGRAFVYRRNSDGQWPLVQVLESPAQVSNAWFGGSIALSGDRMAIGTGGNASGAQLVAVYSRDASGQWVPEANIVSPDLGVLDGGFAPQFGFPVRLAGDLLLTADCDRDLPGAVDAGRGYVFRRHGQGLWMLESRLDHPAPAANDGNVSDAGSSFIAINVALGDSDAIVSFGGDDVGANPDQGSAHVFVRSPAGAWTHQAALESGVGRAGDWMGWSTVRFVGNEALVGSVGWDGPDGASQQIGRVCRFIRSGATWSESPAIVDPGGSAGDRFGSGLAYGGGFLCISASRWS